MDYSKVKEAIDAHRVVLQAHRAEHAARLAAQRDEAAAKQMMEVAARAAIFSKEAEEAKKLIDADIARQKAKKDAKAEMEKAEAAAKEAKAAAVAARRHLAAVKKAQEHEERLRQAVAMDVHHPSNQVVKEVAVVKRRAKKVQADAGTA